MDNRLREILQILARTPSADNSQPWRFAIGEFSVRCHSLSPHESYGPFGPLSHATLLSAGAMHESMRLLFDSTSKLTYEIGDNQWSIDLTYQELPDPRGSVANLISNRHTNRHPYKKEPVTWPAFQDRWPLGGKAILISERLVIEIIGNAVRTCSVARFNCQELHEWLFSSLRWNDIEAAQGDGLDIATIDLPPGGRQFMRLLRPWNRMALLNRLGIYKIMAAADVRPIYDAPAIMAIVGHQDLHSSWEAGRIMLTTWLALNEAGLSVHPYYVVTDISNRFVIGRLDAIWQEQVADSLAKLNKAIHLEAGQQIHMLFRVGKAKFNAKLSARLPVQRLLDTDTQ